MASLAQFLSFFICLLCPVYSLLIIIWRKRVDNKQIVFLVFAGVFTRFLFVLSNIILGPFLERSATIKASYISPVLGTGAVLLMIYVYSNILIKALIRQSEIVSRFFLDSLPAQQLGAAARAPAAA